jgi:hypothetical protein
MLIPLLGSFAGLFASGVILAICILIAALVGAPWYGPLSSHQWYVVGLFWFLLTLVFEFSFGYFAQHRTWAELFEAFTFQGGNIWPIVLVVTFISPWLAAKIRGYI